MAEHILMNVCKTLQTSKMNKLFLTFIIKAIVQLNSLYIQYSSVITALSAESIIIYLLKNVIIAFIWFD